MMDARMKEALERTKKHLVRHLEDLNDEIDQADGRIKDHMVLDGLKDCVKTLCRIKELMGGAESENQDSTTDDSETTERMSAVSALR
jgi:hypothetical protein